MRLGCKQCVVRDWSRADREALVRAADDRAVWRNLTHMFPHPYTPADADAWFAYLAAMPEPTSWAIEVDGAAVGGIGVEPGEGVFARSADFGYWLAEPYWGRGIMTEAVRAVVPVAMDRFGVCRLEAAVFAWNPASMRVLEKCGFTREGISRASVFKDGEITDRVVYALVAVGDGDQPRPAHARRTRVGRTVIRDVGAAAGRRQGDEMDESRSRVKGLGEVSLRVRDLEVMRVFYEEVVGLEVLRRDESFVFFRVAEGYGGHTQNLALFAAADRDFLEDKSEHVDPARTTLHHVALNISLDDYEAERRRLEGLGLSVQATEHAWLHVRSLYFTDPEGNLLEFVCFDEGVR